MANFINKLVIQGTIRAVPNIINESIRRTVLLDLSKSSNFHINLTNDTRLIDVVNAIPGSSGNICFLHLNNNDISLNYNVNFSDKCFFRDGVQPEISSIGRDITDVDYFSYYIVDPNCVLLTYHGRFISKSSVGLLEQGAPMTSGSIPKPLTVKQLPTGEIILLEIDNNNNAEYLVDDILNTDNNLPNNMIIDGKLVSIVYLGTDGNDDPIVLPLKINNNYINFVDYASYLPTYAGIYKVEYSVSYQNGDIGTGIRIFQLDGIIPPKIVIYGNNPYIMQINGVYQEPAPPKATDYLGNILAVTIDDSELVNAEGLYNIYYSTIDSLGVTTTITRIVSIINPINQNPPGPTGPQGPTGLSDEILEGPTGPTDLSDNPVDLSDNPVDLSDNPVDLSDNPVDLSDNPVDLSDNPVDLSDNPVDLSDNPVDLSDNPVDLSDNPVDLSDNPVDLSDNPVDLSDNPVDLSDNPVDLSDNPVDLSDNPVDLSDNPVDLSDNPVDLSDNPVDLSDNPVDLSDNPVDLSDNSVN